MKSFNLPIKPRWLVTIMLSLFFCVPQIWSVDLKTSDLDFGEADVTATFNNLSTTTNSNTTSSAKTSTNLSGFTPFTNMYLGKNQNGTQSISIAAASSPMSTGNYFSMTSTANCASVSFSRTFQSKGAFSFDIAKTSNAVVGLYAIAASGEVTSHANAAVYIQFTGSKIAISAGRTSGTPNKWVDAMTSLPSTDVIEITVIYNNTNTASSYGDGVTLAAKNAHIFVNGTAIMNGSSPKGFYINGNTIGHFRVASSSATTTKIDNIKIYDALPSAAGTSVTLSKAATTNGSFTLIHQKSA